jgi:hypothetical protein
MILRADRIAAELLRRSPQGEWPERPITITEVKLVLCFRNNASMALRCIIDFVMPGVDDWLAIDIADDGHQALLEFVFGGDADLAQY